MVNYFGSEGLFVHLNGYSGKWMAVVVNGKVGRLRGLYAINSDKKEHQIRKWSGALLCIYDNNAFKIVLFN